MMLMTSIRQMSTRIPLIKFRQGGAPDHAGGHGVNSAAAVKVTVGKGGVLSAGIVEDWQLPGRFKRRPISQEECDYINAGGAPQ